MITINAHNFTENKTESFILQKFQTRIVIETLLNLQYL